MLSFAEKEGAAHPYKISRDSQRAHRVLWYPTQAKVRLEWGTTKLTSSVISSRSGVAPFTCSVPGTPKWIQPELNPSTISARGAPAVTTDRQRA